MATHKRKRVVLSIKDKLEVCCLSKKVSWRLLLTIAAAVLVKHVHWLTPNTDLDQPLRQIAATFGVGKSTVYDIIKNEEKLKTFQTEVEDGDCIKKRKIVRRADFSELDRAVYLWFVKERCKGTPISKPLLMAKATQLYPHIYPDDPDNSKFKGGTGWLKRFRDRHGVRSLSMQGESMSAAIIDVEPFKKKFQELVEESGLSREQVFNCDESGLYWN